MSWRRVPPELEAAPTHTVPDRQDSVLDLERTLQVFGRLLPLLRELRERTGAPHTPADLEELAALAADVPSLFHAPTTTHRDRKEIMRILVQRVTIVERTPEYVVATVRWNDAADDTVLRIFWDAHAHRRIAELAAAGASIKEMCMRLSEEHLVTRSGNPWTPNAIRMILQRKRIAHRSQIPHRQRRTGLCRDLSEDQNVAGPFASPGAND